MSPAPAEIEAVLRARFEWSRCRECGGSGMCVHDSALLAAADLYAALARAPDAAEALRLADADAFFTDPANLRAQVAARVEAERVAAHRLDLLSRTVGPQALADLRAEHAAKLAAAEARERALVEQVAEAKNTWDDYRAALEAVAKEAQSVPDHDGGCPYVADDESDMVLYDYRECACDPRLPLRRALRGLEDAKRRLATTAPTGERIAALEAVAEALQRADLVTCPICGGKGDCDAACPLAALARLDAAKEPTP